MTKHVNMSENTQDENIGNSSAPNEEKIDKSVLLDRLRKEKAKQEALQAEIDRLTSGNSNETKGTSDARTIADLVKKELKKEAETSDFFGKLDPSMPVPEMDKVKEYSEQTGLSSVRAYKELYEDDILDARMKIKNRKGKGLHPIQGDKSGPSSFDADELKTIQLSGNKKDFNDYLKKHGIL